MNRRTQLLLIAAGLVFAFYFLDSGYRGWIEEPTDQLQNQLQALRGELDDLQVEQVQGRRLSNRLDLYAARALPWDANLARSRYRQWLLELVAAHQMQSASVNAENPQPIEIRGRLNRRKQRRIGHTIRFTLRARTTLSRLVDFLHDFERSAQLHKIQSYSLNPLGNGSELDLSLVIETLSLEAAERETSLSAWQQRPDRLPPRSAFQPLVQRNIFAQGFSKSLAEMRLAAITQNRAGQKQAWFDVGSPAKTQIVAAGEQLDLPLHSIKVEQIEVERVQIAVNDLSHWLRLGQTVGEVLEPAVSADRNDSPGGADRESTSSSTMPPETAPPSEANEENP